MRYLILVGLLSFLLTGCVEKGKVEARCVNGVVYYDLVIRGAYIKKNDVLQTKDGNIIKCFGEK